MDRSTLQASNFGANLEYKRLASMVSQNRSKSGENIWLNPLGLLSGPGETAPKSAVFGKESSVMRSGAMRPEQAVLTTAYT